MQRASFLSHQGDKDPALYDATYLLELKDICDELFESKQFKVAFIGPDIHIRGDLVNELFDRVPIIVAHAPCNHSGHCGWGKIYTPSNYTKLEPAEAQGLTFWVRQDQEDLILALGGTISHQARRPLRIFFPITHNQLGKSVLASFKHLGHTLVVPGLSFDSRSRTKGPHIPQHCLCSPRAMKKRPLFLQDDHVEVIENTQIFNHPPDVMFITWSIHESDIWNIYRKFTKKPKLVYFTGNENETYHEKVNNFLVLGSMGNYSFPNAHHLAWIPWIDFDALVYEESPDDHLRINSYLSKHYTHPFLQADGELFDHYNLRLSEDISFQIKNYGGLPYEEVIRLIDDSQATLHIKSLEGFGYSVMESLSKGRPVFLKRSLSEGKGMMNWCIEDKSAIFFDSYEELKAKLDSFLTDIESRKKLQHSTAETVRRIVNNDQQARKLQYFLEHLQ